MLSVGQIIDKSWHHFTKHLGALLAISAWYLLIAILNIIVAWITPISPDVVTYTSLERIGIILSIFVNFIVTPILSVWVYNALILKIHAQESEQEIDARTLKKKSWRAIWPQIVVGILIGLAVLATILFLAPGFLFSLLGSALNSTGFAAISFALLLLGAIGTGLSAIYLVVRYQFAPIAVLLQNKRGKHALSESKRMVKGRFWPVFWRVVLPKALFLFVFFAVQILFLLLLQFIVYNIAGLNLLLAASIFSIGSTFIFFVLMVFLQPIILSADYLLYKSAFNSLN